MASLDYLRGKSALWLDFNEGRGTTIYDKSGNGNNFSTGTGVWAPTDKGWGFKLDGIDDILAISTNASLKPTSATWFMLMNASVSPAAGYTYPLSHWSWAGDPLIGSGIRIAMNPGTPHTLSVNVGLNGPLSHYAITTNYDPNTLTFILGTYTAGTLKLYKEGVFINSLATPATPIQYGASPQFQFGSGVAPAWGFNGYIYCAGLLPFVLDDTQVLDLYHFLMGV